MYPKQRAFHLHYVHIQSFDTSFHFVFSIKLIFIEKKLIVNAEMLDAEGNFINKPHFEHNLSALMFDLSDDAQLNQLDDDFSSPGHGNS